MNKDDVLIDSTSSFGCWHSLLWLGKPLRRVIGYVDGFNVYHGLRGLEEQCYLGILENLELLSYTDAARRS